MTTLTATLNHPQRLTLAAEVHSRPFMTIGVPARILHLAIYREDDSALHERLLDALCSRFGVATPMLGAQYFFHDFGHLQLKWERHSEFSTYTFVETGEAGASAASDGETVVRHVPADWLALLDGSILVAAHILSEHGAALEINDGRLRHLFPVPPLVGSQVLADGEIWTDFHVGADGFSRYLIRDINLREAQMGRLVQRLCEIETYLMMALLTLPDARAGAQFLNQTEVELQELGDRMSQPAAELNAEQLLREISELDARVRALSFKTDFRFSAARAYYRIMQARINELRERRIEGVPTIGEFMERRVAPAMDTCVSVANRLEAVSARIVRFNDMLRTHVNLAQERQTQSVLRNLERSAARQLRLQQAVEGLSVVAISYYALGLFSYVMKALKGGGLDVPVDLATGLFLPLIAAVIWLGTKRLHRHME